MTAVTLPTVDVLAEALRQPPKGPVHLLPFVAAGFPSLEATGETLVALSEAGASCIEVGIPFSDPIADGPIIQHAFHEALQAGVTIGKVLETIRSVRDRVKCPLVVMVSYSLVFRGGVTNFCDRAKQAGFDAILCPDLPPPGASQLTDCAQSAGLSPVLLVAPGTPANRRDTIGTLAGGFVYYLSTSGVTGERTDLPPALAEGVADMKKRTNLPVCVGFGISRHEHLKQLAGVADGAVVGSAFVRRMSGSDSPAQAAAELARELLGA